MESFKKKFPWIPVSLNNQYGRLYEIPIVIMVVGIILAIIGPRLIQWGQVIGRECAQAPFPWVLFGILGMVVFGVGYVTALLTVNR